MQITREHLTTITHNFYQCVNFNPHEIQQKIIASTKRFITWVSGARSGKSILAGMMIAAELTIPNRRIWVVGPSYMLAKKEFDYALHFLQQYFVVFRGRSIRFSELCKVSTPKEGSCVIITPAGSFVATKSTENPSSLLGEELDTLVLAEAAEIERDPYERYLIARLGSRRGRQLAFSTGAGECGVFAEFVTNGENNKQDWETFKSTTLVNPHYSIEEYERNKATLDEKTFKEQFGGELVSKRGLVFTSNMENVVIPASDDLLREIKDLPTFVGVKYKYNNKSAFVLVSYKRSNKTFFVMKEHIGEKKLLETFIEEIRGSLSSFTSKRGFVIDTFDRTTQSDFKGKKITTIMNDGIERKLGSERSTLNRVKNIQRVLNENRLKIVDKCMSTIDEFKKCKWPDTKKEGSDQVELEIPLPKYFCCLEAVAHVICFIDQKII